MSATDFVGPGAEPILAAQVPLPRPWRGRTKLVKLLSASVAECIAALPGDEQTDLPLFLAVSEKDRPGRPDGLDNAIVTELEAEIGIAFSRRYTRVIALGRAGGLLALREALAATEDGAARALVAGVDSLVVGALLSARQSEDRLLTARNSNGFIAGEAAACVLLDTADDAPGAITCLGTGFAQENVTIASEEPFRAEGLTRAVSSALAQAGIDLSVCDLRLTDLSGEHYYFREAALTLSRLLRREGCRELWHPADCIGEVGAAISPLLLGYAAIAAHKRYLPGPRVLVHASSDGGLRAAACLGVLG